VFKNLWLRLPIVVRYVVSLLIPVLIVLGFAFVVSHYEQGAAAKLGFLAREQQTKIVQLTAQAGDLDRKVAQKEQALALAEQKVASLKTALAGMKPIPPIQPAPEDAVLHGILQDAGLSDPPLKRPDAVLVWNWRQAALQVPAFQEQLAAQERFSQGLETLTTLQKTQITDLTAARDTWRSTAAEQGKRAETLQGQAAALGKAVAAERTQKYIIGGVAVAGFVYIAAKRK
jgi:hypothetical protein